MNTLATLETNPQTAIEKLLENDPCIISKHTTRAIQSGLV